MGSADRRTDPAPDSRARALAQLAMVCAAAAVVYLVSVVLLFDGWWLLLVGVAALGLAGIGLWWLVSKRGPLRWIGAALIVAGPVLMIVLYVHDGVWFDAVIVVALWVLGLVTARAALRSAAAGRAAATAPAYTPGTPPRRPALIMNPKSGDGKVERFGLVAKAEALGARVVLLDPSRHQDVEALARAEVADGADLLGVAGGDGTQALVAAVAAEHGLPFLVIPAGTRNHFAMDLGLDREDPSAALDALRDGLELRIDLGEVAGRPFVNTASFGAYAQVVQSPDYRGSKSGTMLNQLPDLLTPGGESPELRARADGEPLASPQVLLVTNNPYAETETLGGGRRPRLDRGVLGVVAVRVEGSLGAAEMAVLGTSSRGVTVRTAREVQVDADTAADSDSDTGSSGSDTGSSGSGSGIAADSTTIAVAIDGEALKLPTPVVCKIRPGVLRVRVPRERPGAAPEPVKVDWRTVGTLAFGRFGAEPE